MIAADRPGHGPAKLLSVDATGRVRDAPRAELASLFSAGDLVIANDAATLPGSLRGTLQRSGEPIEISTSRLGNDRRSDAICCTCFRAG